MIAVYIIIFVLLVITLLLFMPLKLKVAFNNNFEYTLKYFGINLLKAKKPQNNTPSNNTQSSAQKQNFIKELYETNSFSNFCKIMLDIIKTLLAELKFVLKHTKVNSLKGNILVATPDAAMTGIEYGVVCTAVYGFLKFLEETVILKVKKININADFDKTKSTFDFSATIKIQPFFLIIVAFIIVKKIILIKKEVLNNERKH